MAKKKKSKKKEKRKKKSVGQMNKGGGNVSVPGYMASANAFLDNIGFVSIINAFVRWDERQWLVSPGVLLKAYILTTFSDRRPPLYRVKHFYYYINTELLFGEGVTPDMLTDSAIGKALERLNDANLGKFFQSIAFIVYQKYEIPINRIHSDTTTFTMKGDYNRSSDEDTIHIEKGHNKDHRPDCKQVVVGHLTNELGMPLDIVPNDGNASDVNWNAYAIDLMLELQEKFETEDAIYVADCKLMTKKLFTKIIEHGIYFISRVPARFQSKLESRVREEAYEKEDWEKVGPLSDDKKACVYEIQCFTKTVYGSKVRLVVVKSGASLQSFFVYQEKERKKIEKEAKALSKEVFSCKEDAKKAYKAFCKKHKKKPYTLSMELKEIRTEKRPVGNPGKNPKPPKVIIEWGVEIRIDVDEKAMELLKQKAESFVLCSNTKEDMATPLDLLKHYKGQVVVELNFKVLKSPAIKDAIYLKKEIRIETVIVLFGVSLMVRSLILYQLRKAQAKSNENLRIGYSNTKLDHITLGLFEMAMAGVKIEEIEGKIEVFIAPEEYERATTFFRYLNLDISDFFQAEVA